MLRRKGPDGIRLVDGRVPRRRVRVVAGDLSSSSWLELHVRSIKFDRVRARVVAGDLSSNSWLELQVALPGLNIYHRSLLLRL